LSCEIEGSFSKLSYITVQHFYELLYNLNLMKKYLLSLPAILFLTIAHGQTGMGFNAGYGIKKSPMASVEYFINENGFSLGFSYQLNDALGKKVTTHTNDFAIGNGDFFLTGDVGYTRIINEKFAVEGELSFGQRKYYTNYSNNSYSDGGYHRILKSKSIVGAGVFGLYYINNVVGFFAGYNSIRELAFGVQFKFVK